MDRRGRDPRQASFSLTFLSTAIPGLPSLLKWAAISLTVGFVAIQFIPVDRTNPPVEEDVPASPEVRAVLRRACYDCHSNETVWPWYSRVAPISWLAVRDVREGREELNFSTWNRRSTKDRTKALHESWEEVEDGEMPLWFYLPTHPEARLSVADRALLRAWSVAEKAAQRSTPAPP